MEAWIKGGKMSEFRIKSATGRWALGQIRQRPWLSEAIDLAEKMGFCKETHEVVMPMEPVEIARAEEKEAVMRSEFSNGVNKNH